MWLSQTFSTFLLLSIHYITPSQQYEPNCFDWPEKEFSTSHYADQLWLIPGTEPPDFSLKDVLGNYHNLYSLLETKHVVLQLGSFTCPQYRSRIEYTNKLLERFGDHVHFLVVYIIEAHPVEPDVSAYSGEVSEACYSEFGHRRTYEERLLAARNVASDHDRSTIYLVDSLEPDTPREENNKVWCAYGPNSNGAYVISKDKEIIHGGKWYNATDVEAILEKLLSADEIHPPALEEGFFDDSAENGCSWAAEHPEDPAFPPPGGGDGQHPPGPPPGSGPTGVGVRHGDEQHADSESGSLSPLLITVVVVGGVFLVAVIGYMLWRKRKRFDYDQIADTDLDDKQAAELYEPDGEVHDRYS